MGDFEVQDWMELAVSDNEDLPNVRIRKLDQFEDELAILAGRPTQPATASSTAAHSSDEEPTLQAKNHQRKQDSSFTEEVDPAKASDQLLLVELFQGLPMFVTNRRPMTQPRQFELEAVSLSQRLVQSHPSESTLEEFAEELLLSMYSSLTSDGIQSLCQKFKVLRYDRKQEQKKQKKKSNRQQKPKRKAPTAGEQQPFM